MTDAERLLIALEEAIATLTEPFDKVAVAYSGGLDSSVAAALAQRHRRTVCYCACAPSSFDEANVSSFASQDGVEVRLLRMSDEDIAGLARLARTVLTDADAVSVSYTLPCLCVLERAEERAILTGSVSDELFAGYAKYQSGGDVEGRMDIDLKKALIEIESLSNYTIKQHRHLLVPYADEGVRRVASSIPLDRKLGVDGRKLVLRDCAKLLGLGAADRQKKAAQYSSGVYKRMQAMARSEGLTVHEWVGSL